MGSTRVSCLLGVGLALACVCVATAQGPTPAQKGAVAPSAAGKPDLELLKGTWIRLEGGYIIAIKGIGPRGELEAMYFNPNPLPFARAASLPGRRDVPPVLRAARGWLRGFDLRADLRSRQRSTQGNLLSSRGEAEVRRLIRAEMSGRHTMEKK